MSIESIRIRGFKTFCDPVTITFSHRLTGVVGPNGSGKSNLVDAIRWGIGEHLPRLLRIGSPQDVIFAGLGERRPLSMAEVSILLDNQAGKYPVEGLKVEILRRIFRDGETEYLINGQRSRVRDVEDLFRGTGLGKQTYSVVGQGEVDQVLSATPAERLQVMEELAGVDVLRHTKRQVEGKLEKSHQSMREIDAHINEQERQYEHLAIQAEVLEKYRHIKERHEWAKTQLLLVQLGQLNNEMEITSSRQKMANMKLSEAQQELEKLEGEPEPTSNLVELDRDFEKAKTEREEALVILSRTGAQLEHMRSRKEQASEELGKLRIESETLQRRIPSAQKNTEVMRQDSEKLEQSVSDAKIELEKRESQRSDSNDDQQARRKLQAELDGAKRQADDARTRLTSVQSQITVCAERDRSTSQRLRDLAQLEFEPVPDTSGLESELEGVVSKKSELEADLNEINTIVANLESELATCIAESKSLKTQLERQQNLLSGIKFQPSKTGLVTIPERIDLSRYSDSDRNLISTTLDWIVSDAGNVGEVLSAIPKGTDTAVVTGDFTVGVFDTVAQAIQSEGRINLTRDGYVVISGIVFLAHEKVTEASVRSAISKLESELEGLGVKAGSITESLNLKKADKGKISSELENLRKREMELSNVIASTKAKSESARKQAEQKIAETEKLTQMSENLKQELARFEQDRERLSGELQTALETVRTKGAQLADFDNLRLKRQEENVQVERFISEARQNLLECQKTLEDWNRKVGEEEKSIQTSTARLKECSDLMESLENELRNLEQSIIESERSLNTAKMTIIRTERVEKEIASRKEEVMTLSEKRANTAKASRAKMTRFGQELHQMELELVEQRVKRENVIAQIVESGGSLDMPIESTDIEELRAEVSNTARMLAEYGSVNMSAKDDATSAQERLNFMKGQLEDIAQSEANLKSALAEVEIRIKNTFEELYRSVEQHFRRLADVLFPGAVGNLKRMYSETGETEGVEVEFMLPGRRVKGLHALSGGEKTLGALALLFAFFKTRSSPFCILDEVDAALDDNNIERFTRLLDTEAHETQFVIITHNKETMRNCDALYGITLDATGTSKVVSVKLDAPA
jgi:chromosome segregation protein